MYKLHYSPFSCSFAVRIALEKIGASYELEKVDVRENTQHTEEFLSLNHRGKVPVLQEGDQLIDQGAAILLYLADKYPESDMIPPINDPLRPHALSILFYMSNTAHPTMGMAFYPDRYSHGDAQDVLNRTLERIKELLTEFEQLVDQKQYLTDDKPYVADYYLATFLNWLIPFQISLDPYPSLKAYKQRMSSLHEVASATEKEMKLY